MTVDFRIVIPARYASSRLPGKPLLELGGRPLVLHVWDRASEAGAASVLVATDDERIAEVVRSAGGVAMMTSADHPTGTDRLAEVVAAAGWPDDDIVVNVQGDEPLLPPSLVADLARSLHDRPRAGIATMATAIREARDLWSPHVVKVVVDQEGFAMYFSRAPIPWARDQLGDGGSRILPEGIPYLRHIGLYAYRVGTLGRITAAAPAPHERAEALEQLRAAYLGIPIHVTEVQDAPPPGVDTAEDLERVRRVLEAG